MAVNSKARTSLPELARDLWGPSHKKTKAIEAICVDGVGIDINKQTTAGQSVVDTLVDLVGALKITWGRYGKLRR